MDYKQTKAPISTITYDKSAIESKTGNVYEAINIIAKRSNQINQDLRKELTEKLEEFATTNENLDEIFENKEQTEVSKYYEKLPKPHAIAMEEWLDDKIYHRNTKE